MKPILAIVFAVAGFAATSASAMPIAPPAPTTNVEQARWVCNEWGRCWGQPDYYRPYGYYRRYDGDEWRDRYRSRNGYGYYGPRYESGYGGWRRGRDRDDD